MYTHTLYLSIRICHPSVAINGFHAENSDMNKVLFIFSFYICWL